MGKFFSTMQKAVIEKTTSTSAEKQAAQDALNAVRKRAAHKDDIALTQANVRKERFVEPGI
ncbi:hypothetical protein NXY15_10340 [Bacteroides thetaiotaomicron]|nr:hypothetical protein NXY15_10340 [Bacteroides thetaiotaomicron]